MNPAEDIGLPADRADQDPEEPDLNPRNFAVIGSSGIVDEEYSVGTFPCIADDTKTSVIIICEIDNKLLVGFPSEVWHRAVSRRKIPPKCLAKPMRISVSAVFFQDRGAPLDEELSLPVWVGFLSPDAEHLIEFGTEGDADIVFGWDSHGDALIPQAQGLDQVASEHFAFRSAESHAAPQEPDGGGVTTEQRLQDLEHALVAIQKNLAVLVEGKSKDLASGPSRAAGLPQGNPKVKAAPSTTNQAFPGLDGATVRAALQAGVPADHLAQMSKLLKGKPQKLGEGGRRRPSTAAGVLSETEPELIPEEPEPVAAPEVGGGGGSGSVEAAIVKLTELCSNLAQKKKESVETLLDGTGLAGGSETTGGPSNRRNAAALRALQKALQENPRFIYESVESNLMSDFSSRPVSPGEPMLQNGSTRSWLCNRSRILNYTNQVRWSWAVCGIWDCLIAGKVDQARARCALLIGASDQSSIDGGSWVLGNVALLEPPPPYHLFSTHQTPGPMELQHSALFDSRWTEVFLGHVKEMDTYQEAKRKLGKPSNAPKEDNPAPKVRPKAKVKGRKESSNPEGGGTES